MAKIALMTIYQVPNYGSVLQAYATQRVIERSGHSCHLIDYRYPNEWHYAHGRPRPSILSRIKQKMSLMLNIRTGKLMNATERFRRKYLNMTSRFDDYEALKRFDWSEYILVTGSDQVWNPRFLNGDKSFMLGFAPGSVRKVSVSSSFACKTLPPRLVDTYRRLLSQYDAISVRENNGADIITSELGLTQHPYVMLDPTLLLPFDEWRELINDKSIKSVSEPYILVYELTYAFDSQKAIASAAKRLVAEYGCRTIVNLGEGKSVMPLASHGVTVLNRCGCSVEEYLSLIAGASAVVTNSFHGTAFAVNAGRPVLTVIPQGGDDRQVSLLGSLSMEQVAVSADKDLSSIKSLREVAEYDVQQAHSRLQAKRQADLEWLRTGLG